MYFIVGQPTPLPSPLNDVNSMSDAIMSHGIFGGKKWGGHGCSCLPLPTPMTCTGAVYIAPEVIPYLYSRVCTKHAATCTGAMYITPQVNLYLYSRVEFALSSYRMLFMCVNGVYK